MVLFTDGSSGIPSPGKIIHHQDAAAVQRATDKGTSWFFNISNHRKSINTLGYERACLQAPVLASKGQSNQQRDSCVCQAHIYVEALLIFIM